MSAAIEELKKLEELVSNEERILALSDYFYQNGSACINLDGLTPIRRQLLIDIYDFYGKLAILENNQNNLLTAQVGLVTLRELKELNEVVFDKASIPAKGTNEFTRLLTRAHQHLQCLPLEQKVNEAAAKRATCPDDMNFCMELLKAHTRMLQSIDSSSFPLQSPVFFQSVVQLCYRVQFVLKLLERKPLPAHWNNELQKVIYYTTGLCESYIKSIFDKDDVISRQFLDITLLCANLRKLTDLHPPGTIMLVQCFRRFSYEPEHELQRLSTCKTILSRLQTLIYQNLDAWEEYLKQANFFRMEIDLLLGFMTTTSATPAPGKNEIKAFFAKIKTYIQQSMVYAYDDTISLRFINYIKMVFPKLKTAEKKLIQQEIETLICHISLTESELKKLFHAPLIELQTHLNQLCSEKAAASKQVKQQPTAQSLKQLMRIARSSHPKTKPAPATSSSNPDEPVDQKAPVEKQEPKAPTPVSSRLSKKKKKKLNRLARRAARPHTAESPVEPTVKGADPIDLMVTEPAPILPPQAEPTEPVLPIEQLEMPATSEQRVSGLPIVSSNFFTSNDIQERLKQVRQKLKKPLPVEPVVEEPILALPSEAPVELTPEPLVEPTVEPSLETPQPEAVELPAAEPAILQQTAPIIPPPSFSEALQQWAETVNAAYQDYNVDAYEAYCAWNALESHHQAAWWLGRITAPTVLDLDTFTKQGLLLQEACAALAAKQGESHQAFCILYQSFNEWLVSEVQAEAPPITLGLEAFMDEPGIAWYEQQYYCVKHLSEPDLQCVRAVNQDMTLFVLFPTRILDILRLKAHHAGNIPLAGHVEEYLKQQGPLLLQASLRTLRAELLEAAWQGFKYNDAVAFYHILQEYGCFNVLFANAARELEVNPEQEAYILHHLSETNKRPPDSRGMKNIIAGLFQCPLPVLQGASSGGMFTPDNKKMNQPCQLLEEARCSV